MITLSSYDRSSFLSLDLLPHNPRHDDLLRKTCPRDLETYHVQNPCLSLLAEVRRPPVHRPLVHLGLARHVDHRHQELPAHRIPNCPHGQAALGHLHPQRRQAVALAVACGLWALADNDRQGEPGGAEVLEREVVARDPLDDCIARQKRARLERIFPF